MAIISIVNQKGGCGKSTTACHLAYWIARTKNKAVVVVDADAQQSASNWLNSLLQNESPTTQGSLECKIARDGDEILEIVPSLAESHDHVIVDGGAGISDLTRAIMLVSSLIIVPIQPTGLDLDSARAALNTVAKLQKILTSKGNSLEVRLLLSRVVKNTTLYREAIELFNSEDIKKVADFKLLKSSIYQRQIIADCFGQEAVVWTMPSSSRKADAVADFNSLCNEIWEVLHG